MIRRMTCYIAVCDVCDTALDAEFEQHYDTEQNAADLIPDGIDSADGQWTHAAGQLICSKADSTHEDARAKATARQAHADATANTTPIC
jgi:hypothetical protein